MATRISFDKKVQIEDVYNRLNAKKIYSVKCLKDKARNVSNINGRTERELEDEIENTKREMQGMRITLRMLGVNFGFDNEGFITIA